jgi:glutaredoxin-related protein
MQLMTKIKKERVGVVPWFKNDDQAIQCGFARNVFTAKLQYIGDSDFALIYRLIDNALLDAGLNTSCLAETNVRVYITGIAHVDVMDYRSFYNYNDIEDVNLTPSIKNLCVGNMSQDSVS